MAERFYLGYMLGSTVDREDPSYFLPKMDRNKYLLKEVKNLGFAIDPRVFTREGDYLYTITTSPSKILKFDEHFNLVAESDAQTGLIADIAIKNNFIYASSGQYSVAKYDLDTLTKVSDAGAGGGGISSIAFRGDHIFAIRGKDLVKYNKETLVEINRVEIYPSGNLISNDIAIDEDNIFVGSTSSSSSNPLLKIDPSDLSILADGGNYSTVKLYSIDNDLVIIEGNRISSLDKSTLQRTNMVNVSNADISLVYDERIYTQDGTRFTSRDIRSLHSVSQSNDLFVSATPLTFFKGKFASFSRQSNNYVVYIYESLFDQIGYERIDVT